MLEIIIPEREVLTLEHLVLDLNGTLACDGVLLPGVGERIARLRKVLQIHLLTANTHGGGDEIARVLEIEFNLLGPGAGGPQKDAFVQALGPERVAAIGNGVNDAAMLKRCALGIAVGGCEGTAIGALLAADVYTPNILDALDL
ncbi:MAG: ATPase P, partial [Caldilineae bacterium]